MGSTDVKYGYITGENMFFFILLKRQLYESEEFPVIRSDNGPQFISNLFEGTCVELNIEHERIPFKTPNDIGAF
ncbi:hypothetical protein P378_16250 [Desulforamulus profundi]|uniref:Integrase catalytic domain-containing protein n=1 Tax=Desulforamulus profundi TaxID=1383067 RepID=A0A2C6MDX1_9FIRM|nr:hypothetical protein [Desulforamulus profundi]PHJ37496.1 hypothetical protein P378_16250 [Desulforamulus profundi]